MTESIDEHNRLDQGVLERALVVAEEWAENGYSLTSRAYWTGMRDTLRVILGITTEPPRSSSDDAAATTIFNERTRAEDEASRPLVLSSSPAAAHFNAILFDFTFKTEDGAIWTPWIDGTSIGYKVTCEGRPDRYVILDPPYGDMDGSDDVVVYLEERDPEVSGSMQNVVHQFRIWED